MSVHHQIDWPTTITAIKDVALGLAAIVTASIAALGLRRWRIELEGKAHFEAARGLARATYKLREAIASVRSPMTLGHEFPESYSSLKRRSPKDEAAAWAHVYQNRWKPLGQALEEFDGQSLEAEALWGESIREKTQDLRRCVAALNAHIQAFIQNKANDGDTFRSSPDFMAKVEETIWGIGDEGNHFDKRLAGAVKGIESSLRPHLRRSSAGE